MPTIIRDNGNRSTFKSETSFQDAEDEWYLRSWYYPIAEIDAAFASSCPCRRPSGSRKAPGASGITRWRLAMAAATQQAVMLAASIWSAHVHTQRIWSPSRSPWINVHGLIWMPAFLTDTSLWSLSILVDRFRALYHVFKQVLLLKISQIGASKVIIMLHLMNTLFTSSFLQRTLDRKDGFSGRLNSMLSSESVFQ